MWKFSQFWDFVICFCPQSDVSFKGPSRNCSILGFQKFCFPKNKCPAVQPGAKQASMSTEWVCVKNLHRKTNNFCSKLKNGCAKCWKFYFRQIARATFRIKLFAQRLFLTFNLHMETSWSLKFSFFKANAVLVFLCEIVDGVNNKLIISNDPTDSPI